MTRAEWVCKKDKKFSSGLRPVDGSLAVYLSIMCLSLRSMRAVVTLIFIFIFFFDTDFYMAFMFFHSSSSVWEESNIPLLKVLPLAR